MRFVLYRFEMCQTRKMSVKFQSDYSTMTLWHESLARYAKVRVAHAPGMPGTFSPPLRVSDSDMHHGTRVTHVSLCMPGSLNSGFLLIRWRGKHSQHFRRMRSTQFYVSGKRPMGTHVLQIYHFVWKKICTDSTVTAKYELMALWFEAGFRVYSRGFPGIPFVHAQRWPAC